MEMDMYHSGLGPKGRVSVLPKLSTKGLTGPTGPTRVRETLAQKVKIGTNENLSSESVNRDQRDQRELLAKSTM